MNSVKKSLLEQAHNRIAKLESTIVELEEQIADLTLINRRIKAQLEIQKDETKAGEIVKVYFAYAPQDEMVVARIYKNLRDRGYEPWMVGQDHRPGSNRDRAQKEACFAADKILVFFSSKSVNQRGDIQRNFKKVLDLVDEIPAEEGKIIPVRIDECEVPFSYKELGSIDLWTAYGMLEMIRLVDEE